MEVNHLNQKQLAARWGISTESLEHWRCEGIGPKSLKIQGHVFKRLRKFSTKERRIVSS
jgi:hypothetical protein